MSKPMFGSPDLSKQRGRKVAIPEATAGREQADSPSPFQRLNNARACAKRVACAIEKCVGKKPPG